MRDKRLLWVLGGAAAVVVLFAVLRPGGGDDDDGATETASESGSVSITVSNAQTETETETTVATETEPPATTAPPPAPDIATVRLTVQNGRPVDGIARPSVKQDRRVRIVVRSDVADHVHLHGYDIMRDVAPGRPAQLVFTAEIPGRFEIELEDSGTQIAELEVRP
jgi:hypothetical protein